MATYPFVRLEEARRALAARGVDVIDFGKGDPNEPTDPMIRAGARSTRSPERAPLSARRRAARSCATSAAAWCERRFGVELDPDTRDRARRYGSKEAIFSLAQVLVDPASEKRVVAYGEPAYPVYERGALFAGAEVRDAAAARARTASSPTSTRSTTTRGADGDRLGQLPAQPDGRRRAARVLRASSPSSRREHDFPIASDEAYTELWFDEPPPSALQVRGPLARRSSSRR